MFLPRDPIANSNFKQVGWSENSWTGDYRHVFAFHTVDGLWKFYDQYALSDGQSHYFSVGSSGGQWITWIWWNGMWNTLDLVSTAVDGMQIQQYFETYTSTDSHPSVAYMGNSDSRVMTDASGTLTLWDSAISSFTNSAYPYCLDVPNPYYKSAVSFCP